MEIVARRFSLTHPRDAGAGVLSSVSMDNANIEEDALTALGMRISCDIRWSDRRKHSSVLVF